MVMYTEKLAILCYATYTETKNATMLHAMRASFDVWKMTTLVGGVASSGYIGVGFLYNSSTYVLLLLQW